MENEKDELQEKSQSITPHVEDDANPPFRLDSDNKAPWDAVIHYRPTQGTLPLDANNNTSQDAVLEEYREQATHVTQVLSEHMPEFYRMAQEARAEYDNATYSKLTVNFSPLTEACAYRDLMIVRLKEYLDAGHGTYKTSGMMALFRISDVTFKIRKVDAGGRYAVNDTNASREFENQQTHSKFPSELSSNTNVHLGHVSSNSRVHSICISCPDQFREEPRWYVHYTESEETQIEVADDNADLTIEIEVPEPTIELTSSR